jgi:hypothetical protein
MLSADSTDIKAGKLGFRISKTERLNSELGDTNARPRPGGESSMCDTCAAHNPKKKKK